MSAHTYVVYGLPHLISNIVDLFSTPDPGSALVRYYTERDGRRWARVGIYDAEYKEAGDVNVEDLEEIATCTRYGAGPDRCVKSWGHSGPCVDRDGVDTLAEADIILGRAGL